MNSVFRTMRMRRVARSRGFTLLEIMVAIFIFALVVAGIYSSWMAIVRGSQTGREAAAAAQRARIAVRSIENALTCARSFAADIEYYGFVAENGSDASLSFVARLPTTFPRGGKFGSFDVRRVTFSLEPGSDYQNQLVLRQQPVLMELDEDEENHPVVLARNVTAFEMEFWEKNTQDWIDDWAQTNQLPEKVKVTLEFGSKGGKSNLRTKTIRIISVPAMTVQPVWQTPAAPGRPPGG